MLRQANRVVAPRPDIGAGSLRVGRLTKPHGLKGGMRVELYTDNPDLRFVPGAKFYLQVPKESQWFGKTITLKELRYFNQQAVGFFAEVADRTTAESIVRAILWIDEETVAAGQEENAWYDSELAGLQVREYTRDDYLVHGIVDRVEHLPAQDLLVVKTSQGQIMVPLVRQIVPEVNLEAGYVSVTPPKGLFDSVDSKQTATSSAPAAVVEADSAESDL